ncbi:hypothetical protein KBI33_02230 [Candidatus Shapirobacteria bacterium]|nr:hypothetical protein [Candidatus Shapirobacteria bacterium]
MAKNKKKRNRQKKRLAQIKKQNLLPKTQETAISPSSPNFLKKDLLKTFICALLIIVFQFMLYWWKK